MNLVELREKSPVDLSIISLIAVNVYVMVIAVINNWNYANVIMLYWFQSWTIGFFTFLKILTLKDFNKRFLKLKNKSKSFLRLAHFSVALFFLFVYGIFHLVSLLVINISYYSLGSPDTFFRFTTEMSLSVYLFFFNHLFSFLYNLKDKSMKKDNNTMMMLKPYARVLPLQLAVMFGALFTNVTVFFLMIKTVVDVSAHYFKHNPRALKKFLKSLED